MNYMTAAETPTPVEKATPTSTTTKVNPFEGELQWLVWSNEHHAWWRPNSAGYTTFHEEAGRYTLEQAVVICRDGRSHQKNEPPPEMMVREDCV